MSDNPEDFNPFDMSPEEIKEIEAMEVKRLELGTMKYAHLLSIITEMGDYIKNFRKDQPDVYEVIEAFDEWQKALEKVTQL